VSGSWAKKAAQAGARYGDARVIGDSSDDAFTHLPAGWEADPDADYLHICSNNTIYGTRYPEFPTHDRLVADMSSEIMSRVVDPKQFACIYAGAQKNLGPSGVVLVILRKDFLEREKEGLAPIFSYGAHTKAGSCLNTPPTFGIYVLLETFRWLDAQGGVAALEARNEAKAKLVYDAIDDSEGFYTGTVTEVAERSTMNITFTLPDEDRTTAFISQAAEQGMVALKGYRTVGGIRASTYNAMPEAGCQALAAFMGEFAKANR
jgi:phosphoserine aminotransferase